MRKNKDVSALGLINLSSMRWEFSFLNLVEGPT